MRRRTYLLWKKLLTRLAIVLVVVGSLYVYFRTGVFTIHSYAIVGAPDGYVEELQTELGYVAEQKMMWFLPGNRTISFHDDEMRTTIMETLPNTKSIHIYPSGPHTITVKLDHYDPLFATNDSYAISKEGVVYKDIVPLDTLPRLSIASTTEVTSEMLERAQFFVDKIGTVLFPVRYISIDEHNDMKFSDASKKSSIIASSEIDENKQWSNILSAIDTEPLKSKLAQNTNQLEYLDARFGNKVFYKFTTGEQPAIIPTHATTTATTTPQ